MCIWSLVNRFEEKENSAGWRCFSYHLIRNYFMSKLHINQISTKLKELFESKIDLSDINNSDKEKDDKFLSRCLAAYAVYYLTECSIDDAALSIVDGGKDNRIDAIYYSENLKKLFIVQSKWSKNGKGEPSKSDLLKFYTGVKDLFELNFNKFNDKIKKEKILFGMSWPLMG